MKKKLLHLALIFSVIIFTNLNVHSYYKFEDNSARQIVGNDATVGEDPGQVPNDIVGIWRFIGHVYHGEVIPPFNDKLVLTFQFFEDGTDILKWYRIGENGFCERTATYQYDGKQLAQQVIAVNPKNAFECGQDTDMRIGTKTISPFYKKDDKMFLELPLGDETLIYIWEPYNGESPQPSPTPSIVPTLMPMPTVTPLPTLTPTPLPTQ